MTVNELKRKEDFRDWMRPALREYYSGKIGYLRKTIYEIVPPDFENNVIELIDGDKVNVFDPPEVSKSITKPMRQYLLVSGKLFRPLLTCMIMEGYGNNPNQFKPLLALSEIIHSSSLMLDDIADSSLLRRGQPCSHILYNIPRSANASSAMTFYGMHLVGSDKIPLDLHSRLELYKALLWEHYVTCIGSALDLGWTKDKRNSIPEDEYIQHILFRSSSYTYRHAARIGAIAACADEEDLHYIFRYSSFLGVAFQLIDDILNLKPASLSWGKTVAEDIMEGKRSLLVLHAIGEASGPDRSRLLEILDGRHTEHEILQEAIDIMEKTGAFQFVRDKAEMYIKKACDNIKRIKVSGYYRNLLIEFARYVIERKL